MSEWQVLERSEGVDEVDVAELERLVNERLGQLLQLCPIHDVEPILEHYLGACEKPMQRPMSLTLLPEWAS